MDQVLHILLKVPYILIYKIIQKILIKYNIINILLIIVLCILIVMIVYNNNRIKKIEYEILLNKIPIDVVKGIKNSSIGRARIQEIVEHCKLNQKKIVILIATWQKIDNKLLIELYKRNKDVYISMQPSHFSFVIWNSLQLKATTISNKGRFQNIPIKNTECDYTNLNNINSVDNTLFEFENISFINLNCIYIKNAILNLEYMININPRFLSIFLLPTKDHRLLDYTYNMYIFVSENPINFKTITCEDSNLKNIFFDYMNSYDINSYL